MGPRAVTVVGVCTLMLLSRGARAQERPEALKRLEASRAALHTAHIEWSRWLPLHGTHFYFCTTRTAGDDVAWDQRGDEDGAFGRLPDGRPSGPAQTLRTLRARGEAWQYSGWLPSVDVYPVGDRTPSGLPELRALGMSYVFSYNDVHDTLWFDHLPQAGPRSFRTTVEEGLHVIRAKADHGDISWWLDPERGWCPVRVTLSKRGQVLSESRSTLKQLDGVWFPEGAV